MDRKRNGSLRKDQNYLKEIDRLLGMQYRAHQALAWTCTLIFLIVTCVATWRGIKAVSEMHVPDMTTWVFVVGAVVYLFLVRNSNAAMNKLLTQYKESRETLDEPDC